MASAASSVNPPTKTPSRAEEPLLGFGQQVIAPGDRRPHVALAVRGVTWSAGQERQPLVEPGQQGLWRKTLVRAAASSIARGSRSSRSQIASTTETFSDVIANAGSAASARLANRVRAVSRSSGAGAPPAHRRSPAGSGWCEHRQAGTAW